jgi:hypothetical protein
MSQVTQTLAKFASGTNHREHELDNVELLARKFLATQAPMVTDWKCVYPYIANDLERLEFRSVKDQTPTHWNRNIAVPLQVYAQLTPSEELLQKSNIYQDFTRHLVNSPVTVPRADYPLLFMLHGARNKNLATLIAEQYAGKLSERDAESVHQHVRAYQSHQHLSSIQIAKEVGFLLAEMPLPQLEAVYLGSKVSTHVVAAEAAAEEEVATAIDEEMVLAPERHPSQKHLQELANNPIYTQYKQAAGLQSHFPNEKVAKQIVFSMLGGAHINASLMGRRQTKLGPVDAKAVGVNEWQQLIGIATASLSSETIQSNAQVKAFYGALCRAMPKTEVEKLTPTELVQRMATVYVPDYSKNLWPIGKELQRSIGRFLTSFPQMDMSLINN